MKLAMQGNLVTQITFGFSVSLTTNKGFEVRVENDFTLQTAQGDFSLVPGKSSANVGQLNSLLNRAITSAAADESGSLIITFTDGTRLQVDPNSTYEAWTVTGPDGLKVICMPEGELAIWPAQMNKTQKYPRQI